MTKKEAPDMKAEAHDSVKEKQETKATGKPCHESTLFALCLRYQY